MEYTVEGNGDTLVVLICGLATKNYVWIPLKKLMLKDSKKYLLCSIELSEEFNTDKISKKVFNILKNILNWFKLGKQINIIGWSLGGMVAQKLAVKLLKKNIKTSLTLIATTHSFNLFNFFKNLSLYKSFNILSSFYSKNALANALVNLTCPNDNNNTDTVKYYERMMQPDSYYFFLFQVFAVISHYLSKEECQILKKIKPLIIAGELDEIIPYKLSLETAKLLEVPIIIIPNAGHVPIIQSPSEIYTAFKNYIHLLKLQKY